MQAAAKTAQAVKMHNEATVRLKELRQTVQNEVAGSSQGTDEIIQLEVEGWKLLFYKKEKTTTLKISTSGLPVKKEKKASK